MGRTGLRLSERSARHEDRVSLHPSNSNSTALPKAACRNRLRASGELSPLHMTASRSSDAIHMRANNFRTSAFRHICGRTSGSSQPTRRARVWPKSLPERPNLHSPGRLTPPRRVPRNAGSVRPPCDQDGVSGQGGSMSSGDQRQRGKLLNVVPALYERVRPSYPDELFTDLVAVTGVAAPSLMPEIGCGTGQATRPLAQLGCKVTAIEPGVEMADIARRELGGGACRAGGHSATRHETCAE